MKFDLWALDDSDLDPYQFRVFCHIARVGICYQSVHTIANECNISSGKASTTRKWLAKNGYIETAKDKRSGRMGWRIVQFWDSPDEQIQQNYSPDEQNVHDMNGNVHSVNGNVHDMNLSNTTIRQQHKEKDIYIYDPMLEKIQPLRTALNAIIKRQTDKAGFDEQLFIDASEILYGRDATPEQVAAFGEWWKLNGWHPDQPVIKNVIDNWGDFLAGKCLKKKQSPNGHKNGHVETAAQKVARILGDQTA